MSHCLHLLISFQVVSLCFSEQSHVWFLCIQSTGIGFCLYFLVCYQSKQYFIGFTCLLQKTVFIILPPLTGIPLFWQPLQMWKGRLGLFPTCATFPLYHEARKGFCFNVMIKCDNYKEREERERERERLLLSVSCVSRNIRGIFFQTFSHLTPMYARAVLSNS